MASFSASFVSQFCGQVNFDIFIKFCDASARWVRALSRSLQPRSKGSRANEGT